MSREKQIEEMAIVLSEGGCKKCDCDTNGRFNCKLLYDAELLYNAGYRKQSEGEWIIDRTPIDATFECSKCGYSYIEADPQAETEYKFCPECGAKMKEGTTQKYFTPSDVRKMSPKEVKENYDLIIQSMKYWK